MRRTPTIFAVFAALLWSSGSARAADPVAPGADAFSILYYINDAKGNRIRQMNANDMKYLINQARCECGQTIEAQVRLLNTGSTYQSIQIQGYFGTQCALAETSFNPQFKPCVQFATGQTPTFIKGYNVDFGPIWLVSGVDGTVRDPAQAVPAGTCTGPGGQSGVWLCGQTDSVSGCQQEEFFITGTQNKNVAMGMESQGIAFDFQPPTSEPKDLKALPGDGAVELTWQQVSGDVYGYRVLCEEADTGAPAITGLVDDPGIADVTYGTIYYTKENLCPSGAFSSQAAAGTTTDSGTTTDASTTDATTTDATTTDATTTDATTTDATSSGTDSSGTDSSGTDTDTTTGGANESSACPGERPESGVCSLKWEYVCSGHIAASASTTAKSRIRGLENGKRYNFLLVAYDQAGNPYAADVIENVAPVPSNDFWEQCEADGNTCGDAGFCSVAREPAPIGGAALALGLGLLAFSRRSRKTA